VSERAIRVVLDASAILAFTRESIAVGEVIAEVADEDDGAVGLPYLSLVEAKWSVFDADRLDFLVNHPTTIVVSPDPEEWRGLGTSHESVGRLEAASAAVIALDEDCEVLTARPGLYAGLSDGGPVIPF
jgi:hypothetical protein